MAQRSISSSRLSPAPLKVTAQAHGRGDAPIHARYTNHYHVMAQRSISSSRLSPAPLKVTAQAHGRGDASIHARHTARMSLACYTNLNQVMPQRSIITSSRLSPAPRNGTAQAHGRGDASIHARHKKKHVCIKKNVPPAHPPKTIFISKYD